MASTFMDLLVPGGGVLVPNAAVLSGDQYGLMGRSHHLWEGGAG